MRYFGRTKKSLEQRLMHSQKTGKYVEQISLNGKVYALKLDLRPHITPDNIKKHEYLMERYKRFGICIDPDGFMWTKQHESDDEDTVLVHITYNTLTCFLRTDYRKWCEKEGFDFSNSEFQLIFDRTLHDVFHNIREAYKNPEKAKEVGSLVEHYMDSSVRL